MIAMSEAGLGTKAALLAATNRRYRDVRVAGTLWRLQSLTEGERSRYERAVWAATGADRDALMASAKRRLLVLCLVDEQGRRLLHDDDADALEVVDGAITGALFDAASAHIGLLAGDLEEAVKN